jgi:hypothetical protein
MASDDKVVLQEEIRLAGTERAIASLNSYAAAAMKVSQRLGGLTGVGAGLAGLFAIGRSIQDTDELFRSVKRVVGLTGMAAENAHGMLGAFQLNGIELAGAEKIMLSLVRSSDKLNSSYLMSGKSAQKLQGAFQAMGIPTKGGPEEKLLAMATAAQKGKLSVEDLIKGFAIPRSQAIQLFGMLKQGPDAIRDSIKQITGGSGVIDDAALKSYEKMLAARREFKQTWDSLVRVLYISLMPVVTSLLKAFKGGLEAIAPVVELLGKVLSKMAPAISAATVAMLALKAASMGASMITGNKVGALGLAKGGVNALAFALRRTAWGNSGGGFLTAGLNAVSRVTPDGVMGKLIGNMKTLNGSMIQASVIIVALIAVFALLYYAIKNNIGGLGDTMRRLWAQIRATVTDMWEALKPTMDDLGYILGVVLSSAATSAAYALQLTISGLQGMIEAAMELNRATDNHLFRLAANPGGEIASWFRSPYQNDGIIRNLNERAAKNATPEKNPSNNFDFRGSRFEITQNFATGFDPNRVAVTFKEGLVKMGEKRLDSGVRPIYSYR